MLAYTAVHAAPPHDAVNPNPPVLEIAGLTVQFGPRARPATVLRDLDLTLASGETLALVGESGSGKSVTALAVTRLLDHAGGRIGGGAIRFRDGAGTVHDIARASPAVMRRLRGAQIGMVFQEPATALNPVLPIGVQIAEAIRRHGSATRAAARAEALALLDRVRLPDARRLLDRYPFELSGGMRQRAMIAIALAARPRLLIADEPTTALDVTVQAQVLRLLRDLQNEAGMAMLFITHDMGVVAELADRAVVLRAGAMVETGTVADLFGGSVQPYTRALIAAVPMPGALAGADLPLAFPQADAPPPAPQDTVRAGAPVLAVESAASAYDIRGGLFGRVRARVHAVAGVSLAIRPGETLGLVGESGCGKSSLARCIVRLQGLDAGAIHAAGIDVRGADRTLPRHVQYVFQDPYAALDPRRTVGDSIAEPLRAHRLLPARAIAARVGALLEDVGLPAAFAARYPHQLSGGQRQRVCIARALAPAPALIVADEPVTALDVPVRAQVVNLLMDIQRRHGVACLFISHDIALVERVAHRVAVMYLGQIVEIGPRRAVLGDPQHAYTRRLLAAVPRPDPARRAHWRDAALRDETDVPSPRRKPGDPPVVAPLVAVGPGHYVARHSVGGLF